MRIWLLLATGLLAACTPAPAGPAPADPARSAPEALTAPAARDPEAAAAREAEVQRLLSGTRPFVRGVSMGRLRIDAAGEAIAEEPPIAAEWARIVPRVEPRLGALTPLAPIAVDLAGAETRDVPVDVLRRAGAMHRLEYLLVYQVTPTATEVRAGPLSRRWRGAGEAEAVVLDVRTGGIAGTISARFEADEPAAEKAQAEAEAAAGALAALGQELEALARRLDAEAMRAAGPDG